METKTVYIKMPIDIWDALTTLAELQDRSLNAQIVRMLRQQLEAKEKD